MNEVEAWDILMRRKKCGRGMMECRHFEENRAACNCTYEPCPRKGFCCECLSYHRRAGELPACFFTAEEERTYDRSVSFFIRQRRG